MFLGYPISELLELAAAIAAAGIVTGILAGLFGIGGGAVIVPVLYEVFRILGVDELIRMQLCIGTSLAIIVPTTVASWRAHLAKNAVLSDVVRAWTLPAIVGVISGAVLAAIAPGAVFKTAFVVIAAFIAVKLLFGRAEWRLGDDLPPNPLNAVFGYVVGLSSGLMGTSGGAVSNLVLTLYNKPIHNAVATSAGIGLPITFAGALGYVIAGLPYQAQLPPLSLGFVSVLGVLVMAPMTSLTAAFGVRLAHAFSRRQLEVAFGLYLSLVALRFAFALLP